MFDIDLRITFILLKLKLKLTLEMTSLPILVSTSLSSKNINLIQTLSFTSKCDLNVICIKGMKMSVWLLGVTGSIWVTMDGWVNMARE